MNPLMANSQPSMNPYATPMTLGTKLIAMDEFARSPAQAVPVDVWAGVLDVYHSHNMSASHLPQLPVGSRTSLVLKSKKQVLSEIQERLDVDAYRLSMNGSAKELKRADIDLVRDNLPGMVERRVISRDPADALIASAEAMLMPRLFHAARSARTRRNVGLGMICVSLLSLIAVPAIADKFFGFDLYSNTKNYLILLGIHAPLAWLLLISGFVVGESSEQET